MNRNRYENPLTERYASAEMSRNWSPQNKFKTWRRLWIALARAEKELGLNITGEQLREMEKSADNINFEVAEAREKKVRHDVMSHVYAFGQQCPRAKPIIHLGATSCFVTDNSELVMLRDGMKIIRDKAIGLMAALRKLAYEYKDMPALGFTHFQPAQLTTVGKRASLWLYDIVRDIEKLQRQIDELPFRGVKGTTGTQASFLALFQGDHDKVKELNRRVTELMGFSHSVPVSGQTYTRKIDYEILSAVSGIAQSAAKAANDIRLLAHKREIEEPFGKKQIGSSAMAYKRNPMRSERICSIARFVISLTDNAAQTHATQWFERTLDDSANRRLSLPQAFLGTDVILSTMTDVISGLQVWPNVIRQHVQEELPFMATENILMACVRAGGDRQELHEAIREHSMEAIRRVKEEGVPNDLLNRVKGDPRFAAVHDSLDKLLEPAQFIGRAPEQVVEFINEKVDPLLADLRPLVSTEIEAVEV